ncbi:HAMP domain-containing sensor histidine kinase [Methyloversatilis sp. XJ19-49]|uniref:sensor histidine kinase n=1 Tax=Methyloversatilis sp. XJ19-49 TaxID=2963429 RepID=UPI00211CB9E5|nr:ATP-binding protein [Methyloversatilis sp. XJ19-49]MCQ9379289.1 ATP-binding protein [Methyloversatilis sp. XJ19-49]
MFRRMLPASFGSRLALVFALLFVLATASALLLWRAHRGGTVEHAAAELLVGQIRLAQALADSHGDVAHLRTVLAGQGTRLLSGSDIPSPARLNTPLLQRLEAAMSASLGAPVNLTLRALPPRELAVSFVWRDMPLALALPLNDWEPALPAPALGWLLLLFGVTPLAAVLAFMLLQRPLRAVVRGIGEQGGRPLRVAVPRHADEDVVRLVQAYNSMVDQLAARDREREQMLAGVSHDIRAPLARLRMRASLSEEAELADGIIHDVASLDRITRQFIDFARVGGRGDGPPDLCGDLPAVLRRAIEQAGAGHGISLCEPDGVPAVRGDAADVERIVGNLIDNAIEYGRPPIVVTVEVAGDSVRLWVSDGGEGLGADALRRACQPFVRLDPARGGSGHCGLGLSIVSGLATGLGGRVEVGRDPSGRFRIGVILQQARHV